MNILTNIGKYSYGMYVIGGLFWKYFETIFSVNRIEPITNSYIIALFVKLSAVIMTTYVMAFISYNMYERFFLKFKKHFI